uniref:RAB30, member RAS oncogene family n=1 Tax=Hippocampus comes TaxID=109280 RepID=A0A3Q2Y2A4_HIPCM
SVCMDVNLIFNMPIFLPHFSFHTFPTIQTIPGLFPPGQGATIGVDFMIKTVEIKGQKVKLQIWDTAGQERFRSITQSYYRSANALILTYDITCEDSFRCLPEWLREIEQYANNQVVTVLVGE